MNVREKFPIGMRVVFDPCGERPNYIAKKGWVGTVFSYLHMFYGERVIVRWDELEDRTLSYYWKDLAPARTQMSTEDFL